jgi:hypothetical protein
LARVDNLVLKVACETALRNGHELVDGDELQGADALSSLPTQELADSLDVLESESLVKLSHYINK